MSDIEIVRLWLEQAEADVSDMAFAALERIEEALRHQCCGCPHRKAVLK